MQEELVIQPTRNSQLSYYVRNSAKINAYNIARRWYCKDCDVEMAASYKINHLKGNPHKAVVAAREGLPPPVVCNSHKFCWSEADFETCTVCNVQLLKKGMKAHLKSLKHQKNAEKAEKAEKAVEPVSLD